MISLDHAIVYDIETICNCYTLHFEALNSDLAGTFEISEFRDDRREMLAWFAYWQANRVPMIGFNTLGFDYSVIHFIYNNPDASVWEIYDKAQETIHDQTMFKMIWESDRFAPQVDLYKIWHFDNPNKRTSLKALQFAMRSETVLEMPLPFDKPIAPWNVQPVLIPYNIHDVKETKRFALFSREVIEFRIELTDMLKGDVLNWNDTKIGAQIVEQRLGEELCYTRENGRREKRQTKRESVALADIIFPFIRFTHPEFNRVLTWLRGQVLREDEITGRIKTKGVFSGVSAVVNGFSFDIGTGGIHGSVPAQRFVADADWALVDIDVSGMYPANMIANKLYPEHLGERFVFEFSQVPKERAKYKKGTPRNKAFKLAGNGTFGNTNNVHSIFYDPAVTMATTVNGQLVICMLAEWLLSVPTVSIIQANTDGITYRIHRSQMAAAVEIRTAWEAYTRLALEEVEYRRMWIRDVNNYVAEDTKGKLKLKGAYWYPRKFPDDITNENAWHKDFSAQVCIMAAVEHMTKGTPIERFIYDHGDPFDFMCRAKVDRSATLWIGDKEVQRIQRYYVAREGGALKKIARPKGTPGTFKRKNGISDHEYYSILRELPPDTWDGRIHSKNKARYPEKTETGIESGYLVADCNRAADFDWNNLNYEWYVQGAQKLVVT
jgi:hypothetical protein